MKKKRSAGRKSAVLVSLGGIILGSLLGLYIFQINSVTENIYAMEIQEQIVAELREKSNAMEFKHLRSSTRENMESMAQDLKFERVKKVTYLKTSAPAVAQSTFGQ